MPDSINILAVHDLVKTHTTGFRAVNGLTFAVPRGSVFGFLGLNGAGKTSTIRIIAGLSAADAGSVFFDGRAITPDGTWYKSRIGCVLDEPLYFEWMSAREYLMFSGTMHGIPASVVAERTEELLSFFDLGPKADDPIGEYSTGMKKKTSIAAAVLHRPELILLDEPLEGIDAVASVAIRESLAQMASRGVTVFITSHVLETVERLCTDIAIIHQGSLLLRCATKEIRTMASSAMSDRTYASLEELFVDLVSGKARKKHLSWI